MILTHFETGLAYFFAKYILAKLHRHCMMKTTNFASGYPFYSQREGES